MQNAVFDIDVFVNIISIATTLKVFKLCKLDRDLIHFFGEFPCKEFYAAVPIGLRCSADRKIRSPYVRPVKKGAGRFDKHPAV